MEEGGREKRKRRRGGGSWEDKGEEGELKQTEAAELKVLD